MSTIVEEAVDAENVLVVETTLQTNLKGELVDHHMGLYHLLRDLLQGKERRCFFVPCHRHNSELAFSQGLSHLKVFKRQF
jgi:hypothetical protein